MPKPSMSRSTAITTNAGSRDHGGCLASPTWQISLRKTERKTMKTLMSVLVALAVLSASAASALADKVPQSIWEQLDREGHARSN